MRTFLALDLPPEARAALEECAASLRAAWPGLAWIGPENYHLTLAFLGEQDEQGVECARRALATFAAPAPSGHAGHAGRAGISRAPSLEALRLGVLPQRGPWNVLVVELRKDPALLGLYEGLNRVLDAEARQAGIGPLNAEWSGDPRRPGRPFLPHLSLARRGRGQSGIPERLDPRLLEAALGKLRAKMPAGGWPSGPLVLYKSELRREGAVYTELDKVSFG